MAAPSYGTVIMWHREHLELSQFEYAVIARCSPVDVINVENHHARLPPRSEYRLWDWGLNVDALRSLTVASKRHAIRRGDPWRDIPTENHRTARELIARGPLTLQEICDEMGLCREMVRQIEANGARQFKRDDFVRNRGQAQNAWLEAQEALAARGWHPLAELELEVA